MIVKNICELFPTAQVAFWFYFIMQFESGGVSNRQFKNWIIPKDKTEFVVRASQALLGEPDHNFRRRAAKYGLK